MNMRFIGAALILFLAGCSAGRLAPTGAFPGAQEQVPHSTAGFFSKSNVIRKYKLPNPDSAPNYMATGSDNNVWFTEYYAARIGRITPSGAISEYPIPSGSYANDIAAGASGTLWFTEFPANTGSNFIGEITTDGHITEYRLPNPVSAEGLAEGPDGNIWFADYHFGAIWQVTPTGTMTEYLLPNQHSTANDIVAGPDGNMWFLAEDSYISKVGKITTGGVITEYSSGTHDGPTAIAVGPDGNLYAATYYSIWRITTAGAIKRYPGPDGGGNSWAEIILGPDKKMWLSNQGPGEVEEFDPKTHAFSTLVPSQSDGANGLTVGSDGDVWIAGVGGNDILVYEETLTTIGIRLNGELSFTDPNYGFELGYAVGTKSTQTQTIGLSMGESVVFQNVDTIPHSAAFLGNATSGSAPWPVTFNGSTSRSPAGTAIGTTGWATGSLNGGKKSPVYETGLPGFYMIGCQYHYNTNEMRTVVVVH